MLRKGKPGEKGLLEAGEGGKVVSIAGAAEEALALTVSFFPSDFFCNCFHSLDVGAV
jgi:hypothetical protein